MTDKENIQVVSLGEFGRNNQQASPISFLTCQRLLILVIVSCLFTACKSPSETNAGRYSMRNDSPELEYINTANIPAVIPVVETRTAAGNKNPYTVNGQTYYLMDSEQGYQETGTASWYGRKFHGHLTSNGEVYDMFQLSAAHKTMPIPSYLKVTNLDNDKSIVVRVNDRGPFHGGRIVDLSYAAAVMLDYADKGTARVYVEAIIPGQERYVAPQSSSGSLRTVTAAQSFPSMEDDVATERVLIDQNLGQEYLQAGAYSSLNAAQNLLNQLAQISPVPVFIRTDQIEGSTSLLHRVRLGPVNEIIAADDLIRLLNTAGFDSAFRVRQ